MDSLMGCGRGGRLVGPLGPRVGSASTLSRLDHPHGSFVHEPGPGGRHGAVSQSFKVSPGSNPLSGCPTGDLEIGTYSFPWAMYVDVAGNNSTTEYTQVTWKPGTVSSGAYAWYGELTIYKSNTSTGEYHYYDLECNGVRYANETVYPVDIIAQQVVWMDTSSSCGDQISGTPEFTIYH